MASTPGKSYREAGDYFPNLQTSSSPLSVLEEESPQQLPQSQPKRVDTPRGCRFRDFDEAHRNITGRNFSNATTSSQKALSGADTSCSESIPLQDLSTSHTFGASAQNMPTPSFDMPIRHIQGRSLTDGDARSKIRVVDKDDDGNNATSSSPIVEAASSITVAKRGKASMPSDVSDNTVDRIYKQYESNAPESEGATSTICEPGADSGKNRDFSDASTINPYIRDGAKNRCGFRPGEARPNFASGSDETVPDSSPKAKVARAWPARNPLSAAPAVSLPPIPNTAAADCYAPASSAHEGDDGTNSLDNFPGSMSNTSDVSNTEILLGGHTVDSDQQAGAADDTPDAVDYHGMAPVLPLRLQSIKDSASKHFSYLNSEATSTGAVTTDSEEDPFMYDNKPYLRPSREREVSAALKRASGLSTHSKATLCSPDGSPIRVATGPKADEQEPFDESLTRKARLFKRPEGGFYDAFAIKKAGNVDEEDPFGVKVVLQPGPSGNTTKEQEPAPKPDPHALNAKNLGLGGYFDKAGRDNVASDRDEWETVATSAAGVGSFGLSFPTQSLMNSHGIKVTGSSIADVSDDEDDVTDRAASFEDFGSTEHIVKHPSNENSEQSFRFRHVQGMKFPVLLPQQRGHRVNGFAQDSGRIFSPKVEPTDSAKDAGNSKTSLARKLSNPFRRVSERRRHRFSPFGYPNTEKKKSAFRKPGNLSSDDDSEDVWERKAKKEKKSRQQDKQQDRDAGKKVAATPSEVAVKEAPRAPQTPIRESNGRTSADDDVGESFESSDRAHSFSFPLISLPEAARIQAIRRASGQEDQTETGNARARRATSQTSSAKKTNMTNMTTAPSSDLPRAPEPAHHRAPVALFAPTTPEGYLARARGDGGSSYPTAFPTRSSSLSSSTASRSYGAMAPLDSRLARVAAGDTTGTAGSAVSDDQDHHQQAGGSNALVPRLYPWDQRRRGRGTDPELRSIAGADNVMARGLPQHPDAFLSYDARMRRRAWFFFLLGVSIFPFISVLLFFSRPQFDNALSWLTKGEVDRLTDKQRVVLNAVFIVHCFMWPALLAILLAKFCPSQNTATGL